MASEYYDKWWNSLQEMARALSSQNGGGFLWLKSADEAGAKYQVNDKASEILASFLHQWQEYLSPTARVWADLWSIPGWFVKQLYYLSYALESIIHNIYSLFGFFELLSDKSSFAGKIYFALQVVGVSIFILFLVIRVTMSIFTTPFKYKEFFNHLILVSAAVAFLPQALSGFAQYVVKDAISISEMDDGQKVGSSSLSLQPIVNNTTDIMSLARAKFDPRSLGRTKGDNGYINPSLLKKGVYLNRITDRNLGEVNFSQTFGADNKELLEYFDKKGEQSNDSMYYGLGAVLHSYLDSREYDKNHNPELVSVIGQKLKSASAAFKNPFTKVYLRYKVNWLAVIIQQVMLFLMLLGLLVIMNITIYKVGLSTMVAPIVGYTSVESSNKFLELLQQIFGGVAGITFEMLIIKYSLWFLKLAPGMTFGAFSFAHSLGFFQNMVASIILYISVFIASIQGSSAIQDWLGVRVGVSKGLTTILGAGYVANKASKGAVNAVFGQRGSNGMRHGGAINNLKNVDAALTRKTKGFTRNMVGFAGNVWGVSQAIKSNGVSKTLGNMTSNRMKSFGDYTKASLGKKTQDTSAIFNKNRADSYQNAIRNDRKGSITRNNSEVPMKYFGDSSEAPTSPNHAKLPPISPSPRNNLRDQGQRPSNTFRNQGTEDSLSKLVSPQTKRPSQQNHPSQQNKSQKLDRIGKSDDEGSL
ncbi:TPA: pLS20_p028 family conjugation system transmembrane protein [Streptococcus agalactiae]